MEVTNNLYPDNADIKFFWHFLCGLMLSCFIEKKKKGFMKRIYHFSQEFDDFIVHENLLLHRSNAIK